MADQQFCLRWNNHQSTLISVFDTLLENGTLVDCTLAAEGQYLKAHKVVLSACSPYLETLLSQHYEKHPIVILKDVKFSELKSMMDYMYRGEVNISQDQLGTFLKAAESLQIKGLSDNGADGDARDVGSTPKAPPPRKATQPAPSSRPEPARPDSPLTDGSMSPSSRKRRRVRRSSQDDGDSHLDSNSCDLPSQAQSTPVPNIPAATSSITTTPIVKPAIVNVKPETEVNRLDNSLPPEALKKEIEPISEPLLEPKTEYLEDVNNEDSVEDLTLDDDDDMEGMDISNMSNMSNMSRPGPSHGNDISNQGFAPWQLGANQTGTDEVFMAAQEAVNQHRDSQDKESALHPGRLLPKKIKKRVGVFCSDCGSGCFNNGVVVHTSSCPKTQVNELFQCQCGEVFSTCKSLNIHRVVCRAPLPFKPKPTVFKCSKCGKSFRSKKTHSLHEESCITTSEVVRAKVVCKCGKECKSYQGLSNHKRYCTRPISPDGVRKSCVPLGKNKNIPKDKQVSQEEIRECSIILIKKVKTSAEDKPETRESVVTDSSKIVKNNTYKTDCDENKKNKMGEFISDSGNESTNGLDAAKDIIEDFRSEPSTPTKDDKLTEPIYISDSSASEDEGEYHRHLPSPTAPLVDTPSLPHNVEEGESNKTTETDSTVPLLENSDCTNDSENKPIKLKLRCKCGAAFRTKLAYQKHKMVLCRVKMMRCNWCPFKTRMKQSMRTHVLERHSDVLLNVFSNSTSD